MINSEKKQKIFRVILYTIPLYFIIPIISIIIKLITRNENYIIETDLIFLTLLTIPYLISYIAKLIHKKNTIHYTIVTSWIVFLVVIFENSANSTKLIYNYFIISLDFDFSHIPFIQKSSLFLMSLIMTITTFSFLSYIIVCAFENEKTIYSKANNVVENNDMQIRKMIKNIKLRHLFIEIFKITFIFHLIFLLSEIFVKLYFGHYEFIEIDIILLLIIIIAIILYVYFKENNFVLVTTIFLVTIFTIFSFLENITIDLIVKQFDNDINPKIKLFILVPYYLLKGTYILQVFLFLFLGFMKSSYFKKVVKKIFS